MYTYLLSYGKIAPQVCHRYERERGLLLIFRVVERGRVVINVHFPSSAADFVSGLPVGRPADRPAGRTAGSLANRLAARLVESSQS